MMETGREAVLAFDRIEKSYRTGWRGRVPALRGVSFQVQAGEIVALLGHNGAGKTTLFKLVLGLIRPTRGGGEVLGRPLGDLQARRAIGFQPEQPYLYPFLTVSETLRLFGHLSGVNGHALRARLAEIARRTGLEEALPTQVRRLSRGWLQRLAIAGALMPAPRLLLLDEPLSGLDPLARIALKQLMRALRDEGVTIVMNSHVLPDVEQLADRIVVLREGRLVASGRLDELLRREGGGVEIELRGPVSGALTRLPGARALWTRPETGSALWRVPALTPREQPRLLRALLDEGATVVSLTPRRESLEEFFTRTMRKPDAPDEPAASDGEAAA
jgi:ABC-2 type transport system ATP-binding protein